MSVAEIGTDVNVVVLQLKEKENLKINVYVWPGIMCKTFNSSPTIAAAATAASKSTENVANIQDIIG